MTRLVSICLLHSSNSQMNVVLYAAIVPEIVRSRTASQNTQTAPFPTMLQPCSMSLTCLHHSRCLLSLPMSTSGIASPLRRFLTPRPMLPGLRRSLMLRISASLAVLPMSTYSEISANHCNRTWRSASLLVTHLDTKAGASTIQ